MVKRTISLILVGLLAFCLSSCNQADLKDKGKGMQAQSPAMLVPELFERYFAKDDYMILCSSNLREDDIVAAMDTFEACGGTYFIVKNGSEIYEEINGKPLNLGDGEMICGIYGGKDFSSIMGNGYAIVAENQANDNYMIVDFAFVNSFDAKG